MEVNQHSTCLTRDMDPNRVIVKRQHQLKFSAPAKQVTATPVRRVFYSHKPSPIILHVHGSLYINQRSLSNPPDVSRSLRAPENTLKHIFRRFPRRKIIRKKKTHKRSQTEMEKSVFIVGIDDSERSFYALEWVLDHFFTPFPGESRFKLVIVHAKPTATSVIGLAGPGAIDVLPYVEVDLKKIATRVVEQSTEMCKAKLVTDFAVEVLEGDARNVLCEAVEKHQATLLAVGSHGYGAIKRAVLGSVSDYCAHHAHCTVMIVKKPKPKH